MRLSREVTGSEMAWLFLFQGWNDLAADGLGLPAAWMEGTAGGRIDRTWYVTFQDDTFASQLFVGIGYWNSGEERLCIWMLGHLIQRFALCQFHDTPKVHHSYPVANMLHHREVMCDERTGDAKMTPHTP